MLRVEPGVTGKWLRGKSALACLPCRAVGDSVLKSQMDISWSAQPESSVQGARCCNPPVVLFFLLLPIAVNVFSSP